jgi:hypothetical protein
LEDGLGEPGNGRSRFALVSRTGVLSKSIAFTVGAAGNVELSPGSTGELGMGGEPACKTAGEDTSAGLATAASAGLTTIPLTRLIMTNVFRKNAAVFVFIASPLPDFFF